MESAINDFLFCNIKIPWAFLYAKWLSYSCKKLWSFGKYWLTELHRCSTCWHISLFNIKNITFVNRIFKFMVADTSFPTFFFSSLKAHFIAIKKHQLFFFKWPAYFIFETMAAKFPSLKTIVCLSVVFFEADLLISHSKNAVPGRKKKKLKLDLSINHSTSPFPPVFLCFDLLRKGSV